MSISPFLAPSRDDSTRFGRSKISGGTLFYSLPGVVQVAVSSTYGAGANKDCYSPIYLLSPAVIDQLAIEVVTGQASSNARCAIYRADGDWQPTGAPIVDTGNISTATTGVKTYTPSPVIYLGRGRHVTVMNCDNGSLVFRAAMGTCAIPGAAYLDTIGSSPLHIYRNNSRTFAAFPTPGTPWDTTAGTATNGMGFPVWLRLSGV